MGLCAKSLAMICQQGINLAACHVSWIAHSFVVPTLLETIQLNHTDVNVYKLLCEGC